MRKENELLKILPPCSLTNAYGLFVGAGISLNSGIPTVPSIINKIVHLLPLTKFDQKCFLNKKFPFEAFMQRIQTVVPIDELLHLFDLGNPNHAHRLIAQLVKKKVVRVIVTTNFDTLIETALRNENISFKIASTLKKLETITFRTETPILLKIHGSIEDPKNLAVILRLIVSKQNLYATQSVLKKFFSIKNFNNLIFLGYSCSDHFDIIPQIERQNKTEKVVYFLEHHKKEPIRTTEIKTIECFRNFQKGFVFHCNADKLIVALGKKIINPDFKFLSTKSKKWEKIIYHWAQKHRLINSGINGLILSGWLMNFTGEYNRAIRYYNLALQKIPHAKPMFEKLAKIATYSAQVYRHLGDYPKAHTCFTDALFYWKSLRDRNNYAKTLSDIGSTFRVEEDLKQAIHYQKAALRIFRDTKNVAEIQVCYIIVGNIYLNEKKFSLAKKYYLKANDLFEDISDKQNEAILLNSLGAVYIKLDDLEMAKEYLSKAEKIASKLGIPRISIAVNFNLGEYYVKKQEIKQAVKLFTKALKTALDTKDMYQSLIILKNRSQAYKQLRKPANALQDIEQAISLISSNTSLKKKEYKHLSKERKVLQAINPEK